MFDCILLMAGSGSRAALDINKVFYKIDDKYLFEYPLHEFLTLKECNKVILVCRKEDLPLLEAFKSPRIIVTEGGAMRQDSVAKGMAETTAAIVLIHDAARYNIFASDILKVYAGVKEHQAAVLANKITDTIKVVNDYKAVKTLDRSKLWAMQTPQGVKRSLYLAAIASAEREGYYGTDDVELIEKYTNISAQIIPGRSDNYKITNHEDIKLCELILRSRNDV